MTTNTDSGWNDVGDRLGSLGLKLKYHAEQAVGAEGTTVNDALENMREAIEEAFAALRGVVTDPAIRDDVKSVADGVAQAIATTLREGLKHPGSIVKRSSTKKATTKTKAAATTTSVAKKVSAAKKAAPAKKASAVKKAAPAKKAAPTKKAAAAKAAPAKKAAPARKSVKR
jgi:hypothetical protein